MRYWRHASLEQRVSLLQWGLSLGIAAVVAAYQLGFATYIHDQLGDQAHTMVEILFYSLVGPLVTWLTLGQIGRWLQEKERAQQAARAHEQHLASIANASADAILSLDNQEAIRSWNRGAELIFGYAGEEMIGQSLAKLMDPDLDPIDEAARQDRHTDREGILRHYETTCLTQDGRRLFVDITRTPLRDHTGQKVGASVILRDITRRKAREAILEEERARIARDLHDGLAQSLYFSALKLDYIRKLIGSNPSFAIDELQALKRTMQTSIQDIRRTIFALRPIDLAQLGLVAAVRQYAVDFGEQTGLAVEFTTTGELEAIPAELEPAFFRLVQEGLNNIAKHAQARHVWIELAVETGPVGRLAVRDDGIGFDPGTAGGTSSRLGLRQMRERVAQLNGEFRIDSVPAKGTTIKAAIPLSNGNERRRLRSSS